MFHYPYEQVKRLLDENGKVLKTAGPGTAVEIVGWRDVPHPGDEIHEVESEVRNDRACEHNFKIATSMNIFWNVKL